MVGLFRPTFQFSFRDYVPCVRFDDDAVFRRPNRADIDNALFAVVNQNRKTLAAHARVADFDFIQINVEPFAFFDKTVGVRVPQPFKVTVDFRHVFVLVFVTQRLTT